MERMAHHAGSTESTGDADYTALSRVLDLKMLPLRHSVLETWSCCRVPEIKHHTWVTSDHRPLRGWRLIDACAWYKHSRHDKYMVRRIPLLSVALPCPLEHTLVTTSISTRLSQSDFECCHWVRFGVRPEFSSGWVCSLIQDHKQISNAQFINSSKGEALL